MWHDIIKDPRESLFIGGSGMYLFEAHYTDTISGIDIIKEIRFNGQFFSTEKQRYLYAMDKAYNLEQKDERFTSLEYISG